MCRQTHIAAAIHRQVTQSRFIMSYSLEIATACICKPRNDALKRERLPRRFVPRNDALKRERLQRRFVSRNDVGNNKKSRVGDTNSAFFC